MRRNEDQFKGKGGKGSVREFRNCFFTFRRTDKCKNLNSAKMRCCPGSVSHS
jgi:hypothetical protein